MSSDYGIVHPPKTLRERFLDSLYQSQVEKVKESLRGDGVSFLGRATNLDARVAHRVLASFGLAGWHIDIEDTPDGADYIRATVTEPCEDLDVGRKAAEEMTDRLRTLCLDAQVEVRGAPGCRWILVVYRLGDGSHEPVTMASEPTDLLGLWRVFNLFFPPPVDSDLSMR